MRYPFWVQDTVGVGVDEEEDEVGEEAVSEEAEELDDDEAKSDVGVGEVRALN